MKLLIACAAAAMLLLLPLPAAAQGADVGGIGLELSEWEALYLDIPGEAREIIGGRGVRGIIEGYRDSAEGMLDLEALGRAAIESIGRSFGSLNGVLAAVLLLNAAEMVVGGGRGIGEMLGFCMGGICVSGVTVAVYTQFSMAMDAVDGACRVMEVSSPVLMTLIGACGAVNVSTGVQPAAIMLSQAVAGLFRDLLMPMTLVMCAFEIAAGVTGQERLESVSSLIRTALRWGIGAAFTFFLGSVSIRCINAAGLDSASVRTLKYAFDKSIPIVGGMISGTYEGLRSGAAVLKNAAGTAAVLLMVASVALPMLDMLAMTAAFRVTAALSGLMGNARIGGMLRGAAESCTYMFAISATVALMNLFVIAAALIASGVS